ncbi:MAG: thermonuclease family protein [Ignavibacteriae bacterium]|nr:thermonuclease family protein [Ignavibacteriota bacterium]
MFARTWITLLFPLLLSAGITGTVIGIHDGDTLRLRTGNATVKVRLFGIDAPELGQPFSRASREKLSALTYGKTVTLIPHGKDAFKRQLAEVLLDDGTNVNHEMVRTGMAYYFRRYARSKALEGMEDEARRDRRGVWSVDGSVPPWEYRKREQKK